MDTIFVFKYLYAVPILIGQIYICRVMTCYFRVNVKYFENVLVKFFI